MLCLRASALLFLTVLAALWPHEARAEIPTCAWTGEIEITVIYELPETNQALGLAAIQEMKRSDTRTVPQHGSIWPGLIKNQRMLGLSTPLTLENEGTRTACYRLGDVRLFYGYKDTVIHIAKEFPANSCAYDAALAHEKKHVDALGKLLHDYEPKIRAAALKEIKAFKVVPSRDFQATQRETERRLANAIKEILTEMTEENSDRQKLVDTDKELKSLEKVCGGAIGKAYEKMRKQQGWTRWFKF